MKNLKKVLALGLALVMLLGMMSFASAADEKLKVQDFSDYASIANKDEAALLVDLGVISGIPDGDGYAFKPENAVQRDAWAKMVYFVMQGGDVNPSVYVAPTFNDVAESNWANGYINYLNSSKIVSGVGGGNFAPTRSVKVVEAAKMLLAAAGWDAEDRGYTDPESWKGSVMSDAARMGLMAGVTQTTEQALTRDNAAKMVVNALGMEAVRPVTKANPFNGGRYVDSHESEDMTVGYKSFGLLKVTGIVDSIKDGNIEWRDDVADEAGNKLTLDTAVAGNASMVGQKVALYVKGEATFTGTGKGKISLDSISKISSVVSQAPVVSGMTVLKTVTGGIANWTNAANEEHDDFICAIAADATYYVNGKKAATYTTPVDSGEVVEFCDTTGDKEADLIRVFEWQVGTVGDDGVTLSKDGKKVTVANIVGSATAIENVTGYQGLAAGDVVLYYTNSDSKTVIEKAASFTGDASSRNKTKTELTISGKAYAMSGIKDESVQPVFEIETLSDVKGYTFWLDKNGDICSAKAPEGATVETKTALVLAVNFKAGEGSSAFGAGSAQVAQAQLLYTDGTTEVVNVAKVGGNDVSAEGDLTAVEGKIVKYSVDSNKYSLTAEGDYATDTAGVQAISAGEVAGKSAFTGSLRANDATVFIVKKVLERNSDNSEKTVKYDVFTGFKNLPSFTTEAGQALTAKDGIVKYAFMTTDAYAGDAPEGLIFLTSTDYTEVAGQSYVELDVVDAEGQATKLKTTVSALDNVAEKTFVQIDKVDEDGVVTGFKAAVSATKTGETDDLVLSGSIVSINGVVYQYDSKTTVIVIDLDEDGNYSNVSVFTGTTTVKANDGTLDIWATGSDVGTADSLMSLIYVVRTPAAAE